MPTIGIVNVNTSESMTTTIVDAARAVAAPDTTIVGLTPQRGPVSVETHVEAYLSAVGVIEAVHRYTLESASQGAQTDSPATASLPVDAWIIAGYGDQGKEALQELVDVPVIDITEAAAVAAMSVGDAYAVVTTLDRTVPMIRVRLSQAGLIDRCVSITGTGLGVLELEEDPQRTRQAIIDAATAALRRTEHPAESICLGCCGMAGQGPELSKELGVPVVDGVAAAVGQAESLVRQGLTTSRIGTFAPRGPKRLHGFEQLELPTESLTES
ncbi:aspartate/glutamate racemase family protein [Corynebacterium falsenii]|uniref:aspartate/glutamate racemase family protein n=1 Tax=Corynebacterium falsenii TaxID=108486 RepID=UPI001CD04006|nr:aspartate/glutamate racemase family protein [Corynebacterium falsenii]UBI06974.1 aspartate/glutamate racemase family protein [Corynebacterium falsenii]